MLDSDPDRDPIHAAAEVGTPPATTLEDIRQRRQQNGAE
jgi:hypothetical protein